MDLRLLIFLFSFFSFFTQSCAQSSVSITPEMLLKLDSIAVKDVPKGAPGIATGIVIDGNIVYEKKAGYADLSDSTLITSASRFNIASNGKQFTALAVLELIEQEKLALNTDIRSFFPELYPTIPSNITIEHLLTHYSGIRDVYDLWSLQGLTWWEQTFNNSDALRLLSQQEALNFEPGADYSYSNSNYILLAEIVGKIANQPFVEYTDLMFDDLNMPNTSFVEDHTSIEGPIAEPYFNFDSWYNYDWIWNIHGDGNIFSTLEDQLEWEKILQTKQNRRFSKELLIKSQNLISDSEQEKYGYGLEFGEHRDIPYSFHGGSTGAWKAISARFNGFSIVTLTNSGKTDPMSQTLASADVLLGISPNEVAFEIAPKEIGPEVTIQDVLGTYLTPGDYAFRYEERDGELYLLRSGRNDIKMVRESANVFHQWNDPAFKQEFIRTENGEMQVTAYYNTHGPFSLIRKEADWKEYNFKWLNGTYRNHETGVVFEVNHVKYQDYLIKIGDQKLQGLLVSPEKMIVSDYVLEFTMTNNAPMKSLYMTSGRIQNVQFIRE